ncbi:nucleotidyltransferase family protein [Occultella glacieicola]|uniref:nucleotidyltransferase family protein n=1 Tax=Occultella glacieicola TaxID=2518684 RepID=UPI001F48809C|nr:nucleotidyltransferase family protein [Occultella glacieicola]
MDVCGVVLAAGGGSRLGRGPKALLTHRGAPLVEHVVGALRDGGCDRVVVVLGAEADRVRAATELGSARVLVNHDWAGGLASSFRAGVAAAMATTQEGAADAPGQAPPSGIDAVLIALVDQPGVSGALVAHLLAEHRPGTVTAARFGPRARPGHPMVLDAGIAVAAAALATGDEGARRYLRAHPEVLRPVDCTGLGAAEDVDVPADLHRLEA